MERSTASLPTSVVANAVGDSIGLATFSFVGVRSLAAPQSGAIGLDTPDRELYAAQFQPGARVVDPIVPSLTPSVGSFFSEFGAAGLLCDHWPVDAIYVNADGALTSGSCDGMYRDLPDTGQFPAKPRVVRQLPISDGLATGLMHRIGLETASTSAWETVVAIGLGPAATYDLTMTAGGDTCTMRLGAVWDLDDDGLIADEYVYCGPETVLACGWAQ